MYKYIFFKNLLCIVLIIFSSGIYCQEIAYSILDQHNKEPLSGVLIYFPRQQIKLLTDRNGSFNISNYTILSNDSVKFIFSGYQTLNITFGEINKSAVIYLNPDTLHLDEVIIYPESLNIQNLLSQVRKNFKINYPQTNNLQKIYYNKNEKVAFDKNNTLVINHSSFPGLEDEKLSNLFNKIPPKIIDITQANFNFFTYNNNFKLLPIDCISIKEQSDSVFEKEVFKTIEPFLIDLKLSKRNANAYYKFRTGIIWKNFELKNFNDTLLLSFNNTSNIAYLKSKTFKEEFKNVLTNYTSYKSDNWDFINNSANYDYTINSQRKYNDEDVYDIFFKPLKNGLFEGYMYISKNSYALPFLI